MRPRKGDKMGAKPRKTAKTSTESHCGVVRGEITVWQHCDCYQCLTLQIEQLEGYRRKAAKKEGIR